MKPRNSISCARLQSKWKCLVQRTEMIWGSLFDDKYIFMRCLSALQIPKAISISYCPLVRRRVAKTKQKWSEEKRNKFNVENSSVFGCTFFKLRYVCVSVCVCILYLCVHAPSTWIFCRFIFHKHIAFWALLSTKFVGYVLTDDGIWHVEWQRDTPHPSKTILFARDCRLFVQLHRNGHHVLFYGIKAKRK